MRQSLSTQKPRTTNATLSVCVVVVICMLGQQHICGMHSGQQKISTLNSLRFEYESRVRESSALIDCYKIGRAVISDSVEGGERELEMEKI